jgi:hypothetical protein
MGTRRGDEEEDESVGGGGGLDIKSMLTDIVDQNEYKKGTVMDGANNVQEYDQQGYSFHPSSEDAHIVALNDQFQDALKDICYGKERELEQTVYAVATVIETRLLHLVQRKYHLGRHLSALKKFMLLGQVNLRRERETLE